MSLHRISDVLAYPVCIVTGLSGAGKSTALRVFEDLRYFTVDGLPASLAPEMIEMMKRPSMEHFRGIALGMDIRQSGFPEEILQSLKILATNGINYMLLFLQADAQTLIRRYATTRRPHPLEKEGMGLEAALTTEEQRLRPLRDIADLILDTSLLSIHDLRRAIQKRWQDRVGKTHLLRVNIISFGFKYGVPKEADIVFDLRFLPNPYFLEDLRPLCGKDSAVVTYIFAQTGVMEFRKKILELFLSVLPMMENEGRYRVTIAFGCTGGRHRSVAIAENIAVALRQADYSVAIEHRHLELG